MSGAPDRLLSPEDMAAISPPGENLADVPSPLMGPTRPEPKRRPRSLSVDGPAIAKRVNKFLDDDLLQRQEDRDKRIQRYAKYRMWTEGKNWPWTGASDIGLPDMMEKSLRVQDTLHNAVLGQRPALNAKARDRANKEKGETVDQLVDYQIFVENKGETAIGDLADAFVNDGVSTCFVPWVRESREVCEREEYPLPPPDIDIFQYLQELTQVLFPEAVEISSREGANGEPWDWVATFDNPEYGAKPSTVSFFTDTRNDEEMIVAVVKRWKIVFDGPVLIPVDYDDVLTPPGVSNLQGPGPSNPGGAPHVILRFFPTVDEIKALARQGYYDLITPEQLEELKATDLSQTDRQMHDVKAKIQGQTQSLTSTDNSQGTVTLLICFDRYDLDGDGLAEDVVFWVLQKPQITLRARYLTEVFPSDPPMRPLAEEAFVPVKGRREGISLLEIQEGIHDAVKETFDLLKDGNTLSTIPFGVYRQAGALKPDNIQIFPGMMYPVGDAQRDVAFPQLGNAHAMGMGVNLLSMMQQWGDRTTMIGDFQLGRVPAGRSSALRTIGSMSMLQAQGDARPERILRRFFKLLAQICTIIHQLNRAFLPKQKQIIVAGLKRPDQDPYKDVDKGDVDFPVAEFDFEANAFNTAKNALQQSLMQFMSVVLNPMAVQLGLLNNENAYRLIKDFGKALGLPVDQYITPPSADAGLPRILAEEAITQIMAGSAPYGLPGEGGGAAEHLQKLVQFSQDDSFGQLTPAQVELFTAYFKQVMMRMQMEQQQQRLMMAMQAYQQAQQGGGQPGAPAQQPPASPEDHGPQISGGGELTDETLPGAGGGANQQRMAAE